MVDVCGVMNSVDRSPDLRVAGLARRHVRGFESEEISLDYMQIRVKTGAVFSADHDSPATPTWID